ITTTVDGSVDYMNATAQALTGETALRGTSRSFDQICCLQDSLNDDPITGLVQTCIENEREIKLHQEVTLHNAREQRSFAVRINVSPIRDSQKEIIGTVVVLHDITELRAISDQLAYQATHDSLTGLVNRQAFEQRLDNLLMNIRHGDSSHALCYLDMDQFKIVNDTCGHAAGDELLCQVATQLASQVREHDVIARLGGDEFGVLLYNTTTE